MSVLAKDLTQNNIEFNKPLIDVSQPVKIHKYDSENNRKQNHYQSNDNSDNHFKQNIFTSFEQEKINQRNNKHIDENVKEWIENTDEFHSLHPPQYMNKPESINNRNKNQQNRTIKSASRGTSEK